jgi:hypothetical protein
MSARFLPWPVHTSLWCNTRLASGRGAWSKLRRAQQSTWSANLVRQYPSCATLLHFIMLEHYINVDYLDAPCSARVMLFQALNSTTSTTPTSRPPRRGTRIAFKGVKHTILWAGAARTCSIFFDCNMETADEHMLMDILPIETSI